MRRPRVQFTFRGTGVPSGVDEDAEPVCGLQPPCLPSWLGRVILVPQVHDGGSGDTRSGVLGSEWGSRISRERPRASTPRPVLSVLHPWSPSQPGPGRAGEDLAVPPHAASGEPPPVDPPGWDLRPLAPRLHRTAPVQKDVDPLAGSPPLVDQGRRDVAGVTGVTRGVRELLGEVRDEGWRVANPLRFDLARAVGIFPG